MSKEPKGIDIRFRLVSGPVDPQVSDTIGESLLTILRGAAEQFPDLKLVVGRYVSSGCGIHAHARATAKGDLTARLNEASEWVIGVMRTALAQHPEFREVPA